MTYISPILLLGLCLVFAVLVGGLIYALYRQKRSSLATFEQLNALDIGLIFFGKDEEFTSANERGQHYLEVFKPKLGYLLEAKSFTLKAFLDFTFDHAIEWDESLNGAIRKRSYFQDFREVIQWDDDRIYLVEVKNTDYGDKIVALQDLSDIKKEEEQVLKLNNYSYELTKAMEATSNGVVIINLKNDLYEIAFANKAFFHHINVPEDKVIGQDAKELFAPFLDDENFASLERALQYQTLCEFEIELDQGKEAQWFNLKITPIENAFGRLGLFIGDLTDISELKQREAEFFKAQKLEALGQLAAGVAHDFNNVLSIIDGYARFAINNWEDKEAAEDHIEKIRTASARGAELVKQMLTFGRHKIVSDTVINLSESVQEAEVLLRPIMAASIDLSIQIKEEDIFVECAQDNLIQILMNLTINARDAMEEGGRLIIGLRSCTASEVSEEHAAEDLICLYVTDTGAGMDAATQEKIFDPFFTTKAQGKGTGLGLSMVYGLVKQIGGSIDVKSVLGHGTTFSIFLPRSDKAPTKQISGSPEDQKNFKLEGYTALLAEDEPDLLILMQDMLEGLGMNVIAASNGNEALLKQEDFEGDIDLLLTDVVMPELDGVRLAELFCSVRPDTQVIYMSGYPARGEMAQHQLPEDAYFMAKPVSHEALANVIFSTLTNKNATLAEAAGQSARWEASEEVGQTGGGHKHNELR